MQLKVRPFFSTTFVSTTLVLASICPAQTPAACKFSTFKPPSGYFYPSPADINNNGTIVGSIENSQGFLRGFERKADGSMSWEFDLVGIIDAEDPAVRRNTDVVLINAKYFDEARLLGKGRTGWYIERIADPAQARAIAAEIDRLFANSPDETKTQPEKEFAIGFAKQIGDIGALVTRILIAVFFTILILTGNTMAQSIRERIPELAILKTLGFSDGKVTALVLAEAILLLILGGALGMGAAVAAMPALNGSTGGRFPPLFVGPETWLLAAAIAAIVALIIGLPPALRANRLKIVDALSGH